MNESTCSVRGWGGGGRHTYGAFFPCRGRGLPNHTLDVFYPGLINDDIRTSVDLSILIED